MWPDAFASVIVAASATAWWGIVSFTGTAPILGSPDNLVYLRGLLWRWVLYFGNSTTITCDTYPAILNLGACLVTAWGLAIGHVMVVIVIVVVEVEVVVVANVVYGVAR